jgi:signal transduction histidine kinase
MQVVDQVAPILDNIRLLERLSASAADQERQRLARDIHDSVVQPYLGLQYKLAAIRNKAVNCDKDLSQDIERLFNQTVDEIGNLRGFVGGLKEPGKQRDDLVAALRRFADHFSQSYDIDVRVACKATIDVSGRLAAEVIPIVHEGLSNIRKHTQATSAIVQLDRSDTCLTIFIENNGGNEGTFRPFYPRSITERAEELGGQARVLNDGWCTVVKVEIPL